MECLGIPLCLVPKCGKPQSVGPFCAGHAIAPATRRAGWVSAARRREATVSCIDASNVAPRLWVGAAPPTASDIPNVQVLVLCAQEIQPATLAFRGTVLRAPMIDGAISRHELNTALGVSSMVAKALVNKQRCLVTCAMGRNRSAFVAALALARITRLSADDLVKLMRTRRDNRCLSNEHFVGYLQKFVGTGRRR